MTLYGLARNALAAVCWLALASYGQSANAVERPSLSAAERAINAAKRQIAGHTVVRNWGRFNEVLYFAPNNIVHQWVSGRPTVVTSDWTIDNLNRPNEAPKPAVCTRLPHGPETGLGSDDRKRMCIEPSLIFSLPGSESSKGDIFGLARRSQAPADLPVGRVTIEDIKRATDTGARSRSTDRS